MPGHRRPLALAHRPGDLVEIPPETGELLHGLLQELYVRLYDTQYNLGKPSIAAVGGAARGGGMTMAISCDVILAGRSATFGYPEIDAGVIPAIHFAHLPRIVGRHRAFELLFSGRSFGAEEAYRLGLVSRVVTDEELVSHAQALAETFAAKSAVVMSLGLLAGFAALFQSFYPMGSVNQSLVIPLLALVASALSLQVSLRRKAS